MGDRHALMAAVMILVVGFTTALWIYLSAAPPPDLSEIGLNESKPYQRQVELYGGKANVLAIEAMDWLRSLAHGRRLAITVACVTVIVAAGFWLFADVPRDSASSAPLASTTHRAVPSRSSGSAESPAGLTSERGGR